MTPSFGFRALLTSVVLVLAGCSLEPSTKAPSKAATTSGVRDTKGWGKIEWGMTIQQVMEHYPEAQVSHLIDTRTGLYHNTNGEHAQRLEFDTDVAGRKMHARIYSRSDSDLVSMVSLEETGTDFFANNYVQRELEELLTLKYGPPQHTEEKDKISTTVTDTWVLPSTIIKLEHRTLQIEMAAVELRYMPASMLNGL
jgi:hypothetical protein